MSDDISKKRHGVFTIEYKNVLEIILDKIKGNNTTKKANYMTNLYCVEIEDCGYMGGKNGDKHRLDYVVVVTDPSDTNIITMFPTDESGIEQIGLKRISKEEVKAVSDDADIEKCDAIATLIEELIKREKNDDRNEV